MNIKGGALEFDIIANNGQINSALEETKKRVQGFTTATVEGGEKMEAAYNKAAAVIEAAWKDIDTMTDTHSAAIVDLEREYARLGEAAAAAYHKGTAKGDEEYRTLTAKQNAVRADIAQRKQMLQEIGNTADALLKEEQALNSEKKKTEETVVAKKKLTTQLREITNELAEMESAGLRGTDAYNKLQAEAGRLTDALGDVRQQAKVLGDDNAGFQGVISAVSGVAGAFSAAQGAIGLFAGENENLQKIMVKVQSLMAITIGLQQVANTLNKDSYFRIVTLTKAKQLLATTSLFLGKAFVKMGLSATTAKIAVAGLYATLTLGLSLAITGVMKLIDKFNEKQETEKKKAEEAGEALKKQQERLDGLAKSYSEQLAVVTTLRKALDSEKYSYNDKLKVIKKLQEIIPDYNAKLSSEGKIISDNKAAIDAYLISLEKTLRFKAAMEDMAEVYKEIYKIEKGQGAGTDYKKTVKMMGGDVEIIDYDKLAQKHGLKNAKDVSPDILNTWLKMEEGLTQVSTDMNNKRLTELKGQISDIQKYVSDNNLIDLTTGKTGGTVKDPFTEMLEKRKAQYTQYFKWVNSKDPIIQKAAQTEFSGLLKEGSSYIAYLEKQRQALLDLSSRSPEQIKQLAKLNDEIANETKKTVLAEFDSELQNQLKGARTILEMLTILDEKRKALSSDGSDLDGGKKDIIDKQQEEVAKQAEKQSQDLLDKYSDYLSEKIAFETSYAENSRLLSEKLAKAKTEDERNIALEAIRNLNKEKQKYASQTGNSDYDALTEQYKTYQQKCADIAADYDVKIALATQKSNADLVAKLQEEKTKALSSAALDELQSSGAMEKLLGNLDDLTISQIEALIAKIESQRAQLGVELDPADLEVILNKIQAAKNEIQERNPFKALQTALKDYQKDSSKANLTQVFTSVASSIDLVKGSFDAVTSGLANMGLAGDEVTQQLLGDIGEMIGSSGQLAQGIATGNPLSIIQGSIGLISSAFNVFNTRDRNAERAIKKHAAALNELQKAYDEIERSVDAALGGDRYSAQKNAISNMKQQQQELAAMTDAERSKKKADNGKIEEYENQINELNTSIKDAVKSVREDLIGGTSADIAASLGNAFFEAFAAGEDALAAFNKKAEDVVANIIQKMLIQKLLEQPIGNIIDKYSKSWYDDNGNFAGFDAVINSAGLMGNELKGIGSGFAAAMESLPDDIKKYFIGEDNDINGTLSGAIKGASQESIDLLAGQTNAVRVNQVVSIDILREQLIHLANIDSKLGISNQLLKSIERNTSGNNSDPLRAQGITL